MKVLFLTNSPIWKQTLPLGFRNAGHEVLVSGPLRETRIPSLIQSFGPGLIVTMGWGLEQQHEQQIMIRNHVHAAGIPHVYWATEDPNFTTEFTLPLLQTMQPDFVFTICERRVPFYENQGIHAAHLDFGYGPWIHRRTKRRSRYHHDIVVVANAYPEVLERYPTHYRMKSIRRLIRPLVHKGVRIDFYGRDWDKMGHILDANIPRDWLHGPLPYSEGYKVYNSARVVIGLQNYRHMVTMRTYEVMASGGFLLTSDTPGVRRLATPGRDLIVSSSARETARLVHYYLKASNLRHRIRHHGRDTVRPHSYTVRAQEMVEVLQARGVLPL